MEKNEEVFCNSLNLIFIFRYGTINSNIIDSYIINKKNGKNFSIPTDENSIKERLKTGEIIVNNIIANIKDYEFTFVKDKYISILLQNAIDSSLRDNTLKPLEFVELIIDSANEKHVNIGEIDKKIVEELLKKNKNNPEIIKKIKNIYNNVRKNNMYIKLSEIANECYYAINSFAEKPIIKDSKDFLLNYMTII